jgi:thiamine-monophosphate kinase
MNIGKIGELGLIKRLTRGIALDRSVIKGAGDDAAVIAWTAKKYLLYTCDMLVEDVHFKRQAATPFQIGWKALGRNISDIAAMGGFPRYAVVSLALPAGIPVRFASGVYRGIKKLASSFGVNIVGGDVSRSGKVVIDVALIGEVEKRRLVTRSGAKKGDLIFVTGSIGGSIKGRHLDFMPRVDEARELVKNFKVHSMIDITDGLLLDLWRVLDASGVGGRIRQDRIPVSRNAGSFDSAVRDGEDFELLFTMGPRQAKKLIRNGPASIKTKFSLIGEIVDKRYGLRIVREDGRAEKVDAKKKGYLHF